MTTLPRYQASVELKPSLQRRPQISHVVLDFDGTLSWVRHGWPRIMLRLFREHLIPSKEETEAKLDAFLINEVILGMNGRPTILQMVRFAEIVSSRTGTQLDPEELRQAYQTQLDQEIAARARQIREGIATQDDFVVFGGRAFLQYLSDAGLVPIILSSTIEERVREEAKLLGITHFFGPHIYGSTGDPTKFSKMAVFQRLLAEAQISGDRLLSFGDGPVELANTKELGGVAIGVCSDEDHNGSGVMDAFKKKQLSDSGADALIPDFRDAIALTQYLLGR